MRISFLQRGLLQITIQKQNICFFTCDLILWFSFLDKIENISDPLRMNNYEF